MRTPTNQHPMTVVEGDQRFSAKVYVTPPHLTHEKQIVDLLEKVLEHLQKDKS
jgi:hypothetical protein